MQAYALPEVVELGEEEQARLAEVVDATVREAQRATAATLLEAIGGIARGLPGGIYRSMSLGVSAEAVELLSSLGGAQRTLSVYDNGTAIDGAHVTIAGIDFHAQTPARDATPDELAERERREEEAQRPSGFPVEVLS